MGLMTPWEPSGFALVSHTNTASLKAALKRYPHMAAGQE